jgi:O-antigen/teichoic acid export membrane protein
VITLGLSVFVVAASWAGGARLLEVAVFNHPNFAKAFVITVVSLPFLTDLTVLGGACRGLYRPLPSVMAQSLLQPVVRILSIVGCLAIGQNFLALPLGIVIGAIVSWMILQYQVNGFLGTSSKVHSTPLAEIKDVLSYSTPLSLAIMVTMLMRMLDLLLIGYFRTPEELGEYSVVLLMTQLMTLAPAALSQTLGARVAAAYAQANAPKVRTVQVNYAKQIALVSAPIFACIVFWGDRIDLLIGEGYNLDWRVIGVAATSAAWAAVTNGLGHTLGMTGYQMRELGIIVAGFAIQSIGGWILIPQIGQMGAALTSLGTVFFIWIARLWTIRRRFDITPITASVVLPFAVACAVAGGVYQIISEFDVTLIATAVSCFASVIGYSCFVLAFRSQLRNAGFFSN